MHDSGGERAMFADLAADLDVPFAQIGSQTVARIADLLDPGMEAENPLDAWGTGIDGDAIFLGAFAAFADDPEVGVSVFCVDMTVQGEPYNEGYLQISIDRFEATDKPFCVLSNLASAVSWDEAKVLRDRGIPVLEGTDSGLAGAAASAARRGLARPSARGAAGTRRRRGPGAVAGAASRLARRCRELDGLALLADYGLPVVAARPVATAADATAPPSDRVPGRAEDGRTRDHAQVRCRRCPLGLPTPARSATRTRTSPGDSVPRRSSPPWCPRGSRSRSVWSWTRRSARWCWLRRAACSWRCCTTGVSRSLRSTRDEARRLIDGLQIRPILDGVRGAPPADVDGLADAVSRLSVLAADLGDLLAALDVNPMIVSPDGCIAVDALVEPRPST